MQTLEKQQNETQLNLDKNKTLTRMYDNISKNLGGPKVMTPEEKAKDNHMAKLVMMQFAGQQCRGPTKPYIEDERFGKEDVFDIMEELKQEMAMMPPRVKYTQSSGASAVKINDTVNDATSLNKPVVKPANVDTAPLKLDKTVNLKLNKLSKNLSQKENLAYALGNKTSHHKKDNRNFKFENKDKELRSDSIRKIFRLNNSRFWMSADVLAVPGIPAINIRQFVNRGYVPPIFLVPNLACVKPSTFIDFFINYAKDACHIDMTKTDAAEMFAKSMLDGEIAKTAGKKRIFVKSVIPTRKTDGTRDPHALDFMIKLLKHKFGGSIKALMEKSFKLCPTTTCHIYKYEGEYKCHHPPKTNYDVVKMCSNCKVCNFISTTLDQNTLDQFVCGVCCNPLNRLETDICWNNNIVETNDITQMRVGATEVKMSEMMNQLDGAQELSQTTAEQLVQQDLKNMRSIMSRKIFRVIKVSNGITKQQLKYLKSQSLSYNLIQSRATPNPHAMIASERKIIWYYFMEKIKDGQVALDVGTRKIRDESMLQKWHGMGPKIDWRDVERYGNDPLPPNTCSHTVENCSCLIDKHPVIISVDSLYDINAKDVIELMVRTKADQLLYTLSTAAVDFTKNSGDLYYDQGSWCKDGSKFLTTLAHDDRPYENSWYHTKMWSTADVITHGDYNLYVTTYNTVGNHIVRVGILTKNVIEKMRYISNPQVTSQFKMEVPIIQHNSILAQSIMPIIVHESRIIDLNLFKSLYSRNLTSNLSFEKMVEFGLAYAHTKYTTPTRMVSYQHITADDVRLHAMLATVHSRRKMSWLQETELMNDPMTSHGMSFSANMWTTVVEYVLRVLKSYMPDLDQQHPIVKTTNQLNDLVKDWLDDEFWDLLDTLWDPKFKLELTQYDTHNTPEIETTTSEFVCAHHSTACQHSMVTGALCQCCQLDAALHNGYCHCCHHHKCKHKCKHVCKGLMDHFGTNSKSKICDCCQVEYTTDECEPCKIWPGKRPNDQEPRVTKSTTHDDPVKFKVFPANNYVSTTGESKPIASQRVQKIKKPKVKSGHDMPPLDPNDPNNVSDDDISYEFVYDHEKKKYTFADAWRQTMGEEVLMHEEGGTGSEPKDPNKNDETHEHDDEPTEDDKLALSLTRETNFNYAMVIINGFLTCVQNDKAMPCDYNPVNKIGISQIKYQNFGSRYVLTSNFKVIQTQHVSGEEGLCGYFSIKHVLGDECHLSELRDVTGKKNWWNNEELAKYLSHIGRNSLFILPGQSYVNTVNGMDDHYVCFVHGEVKSTKLQHWEPCNVLMIDTQGILPCYQGMWTASSEHKAINRLRPNKFVEDLTMRERMQVALNLIDQKKNKTVAATNKQLHVGVVVINGTDYATNNKENIMDPKRGLFFFKLTNQEAQVFRSVSSLNYGSASEDLFSNTFDVEELTKADIQQVKKGQLTENCAYLNYLWQQAEGKVSIVEQMWKRTVQRTAKCSDGTRCFDVGNTKLKTGDMVCIQLNVTRQCAYVVVKQNKVFFVPPSAMNPSSNMVTILIPKSSYKSRLLQVWFCTIANAPWNSFVELLRNSKVTLGPAGSGKTTKLVEQCNNKDIIIARTRVAVNTIRTKLDNNQTTIMTYEQYCTIRPKTKRLIIDECTMFTWLDLYLALSNIPDELIMFGDNNQVGVVDTGVLGGERDITPINAYSENTKILTNTYRFGRSLCKILNDAGIEIQSKCEYDTQIIWHISDELDENTLHQLIATHKPNVVLTFYNKIADYLRTIIKVAVSTVHSYQSKESDVVLVLQQGERGMSSRVWLNKHYCISAATRAKTKLIWYAVGLPKTAKLVDVLRGNRFAEIRIGESKLDTIVSQASKIIQSNDNTFMHNPEILPDTSHKLPMSGGANYSSYTMTGRLSSAIITDLIKESDKAKLLNWSNASVESVYNRMLENAPAGTTVESTGNHITVKISRMGGITFRTSDDNSIVNVDYSNYVVKNASQWIVAHNYSNQVTEKLSEVACEHSENTWFHSLPARLQEILVEKYANKLGIIHDPTDCDTEEEYHDVLSNMESHDEDSDYEDCFDEPDDITTFTLMYPLAEQVLRNLLADTINDMGIGFGVTKTNDCSKIVATCCEKSVLECTIECEGLKYIINNVKTDEKVLKNMTILCSTWNDIIGKKFNNTNLWYTLSYNQQRFLTENFDWIMLGDGINAVSNTDLQELIMDRWKELEESGAIMQHNPDTLMTNLDKLPHPSAPDPQLHTVWNAHNSCNSYHYCVDADSWWKDNTLDLQYKTETLSIVGQTLTAVRLLCETAQLYENMGEIYSIDCPNGEIALNTFGGCSACSGLAFSMHGITFMKVGPQKNMSYSRKLLFRECDYYEVMAFITELIKIKSQFLASRIEVIDMDVDYKNYIHPLMRSVGYEAGMIIERISIVPRALWGKLNNLKNAKLCMQFENSNMLEYERVKSVLKDGWRLSSTNSYGSHVDAKQCVIKIEKSKLTAFVLLGGDVVFCTASNAIKSTERVKILAIEHIVAEMLRRRIAKWPWKLARWCCQLLHDNDYIGAEDDISTDALNLPVSYHKMHGTEVYQYFRKRAESELLANKIKVQHIVFVHKQQYDMYNHLIKQECVNMPIEIQSYDIIERGFDMLVELIGMKYTYNGLKQDDRMTVATVFPYLSMATSCWGAYCHYMVDSNFPRYRQNVMDCAPIIAKMKQVYNTESDFKPKNKETDDYYHSMTKSIDYQIKNCTGPWYTEVKGPIPKQSHNIYFGLHMLGQSPRNLFDIMQRQHCSTATIMCPMQLNQENTLFRLVAETEHTYELAYDGTPHTLTLNKSLSNCILQGEMYVVGDKTMIFHNTSILFGHSMATIVIIDQSTAKPEYCRPQYQHAVDDKVTFIIPKINDLRKVVKSMSLLDTKEVEINSRFYRALSLRMLRSGTTFNDLLAYARTYVHAVTFSAASHIGKSTRYDVHMMEACLCVYYESTRANESIAKLAAMLSDTFKPSTNLQAITDAIKTTVQMIFGELLGSIGATITVDEIIQVLNALLIRAPHRLVSNLTALTITKVIKKQKKEKIIKRADHVLVAGNLLDRIETTKNLFSDTTWLAISGAKRWWWLNLMDSQIHKLHMPSQKESVMSRCLRVLENNVGRELIEVLNEMIFDGMFPSDKKMTADLIKTIVSNVKSPIELTPLRTAIQQLNEDCDANIPDNQIVQPASHYPACTMSELRRRVLNAAWQYGDNVAMMKGTTILFSTIGSMGDVEPFLALAIWLREFDVRSKFMVPIDYVDHIKRHDFEVMPLNVYSQPLVEACVKYEKDSATLAEKMACLYDMFKLTSKVFEVSSAGYKEFVRDANLVVETPFTHVGCQLAQYHNVPFVLSAAYPWEYSHGRSTKAEKQGLLDFMAGAMTYAPFIRNMAKWRAKELNLSNSEGTMLAAGGTPMLYLHPLETLSWTISKHSHVMGYAEKPIEKLSEEEKAVIRWCANKSTAAICYGSMVEDELKQIIQMSIDKLPPGIKQVLIVSKSLTSRSFHSTNSLEIRSIKSINYHALFATTVLVVTHGGSGTTHNAVRHGNCVLIRPFFGDQFAWLKSMTKLGAGWDFESKELDFRGENWISNEQLLMKRKNARALGNAINASDMAANFVASFRNVMVLARQNVDLMLKNKMWNQPVTDVYNHEQWTRLVSRSDDHWGDMEDIPDIVDALLDQHDNYLNGGNLHSGSSGSETQSDVSRNDDGYSWDPTYNNRLMDEDVEYEQSMNEAHDLEFNGGTSAELNKSEIKDETTPISVSVVDSSIVPTPHTAAVTAPESEATGESMKFVYNPDKPVSKKWLKKKNGKTYDPEGREVNPDTRFYVLTPSDLARLAKELKESMEQTNQGNTYTFEPEEKTIMSLCKPPMSKFVIETRTRKFKPNTKTEHLMDSGKKHIAHSWSNQYIMEKLSLKRTARKVRISEVYRLKLGPQLYNPNNAGDCVYDCMEFLMKTDDWAQNDIEGTLSSLKELCVDAHMPSFWQVVSMLILLQIDVVVTNHLHNLEILFNDATQAKYILEITYTAGVGHATINEFSEYHDSVQMLPQNLMYTRLHADVNQCAREMGVSAEDLANNVLCHNSEIQDFVHNTLKIITPELQGRMTMSKLYYTLIRHVARCAFVHMASDGKFITVDKGSIKVNTGMVVLVQSTEKFIATVALKAENCIILMPLCCHHPVSPTGFVIMSNSVDGRIKTTLKTIDPEKDTATCLNMQTKKFVLTSTNLVGCDTIAKEGCSKLIIHSYDGRSHHKYDDLDVIKRFRPIDIVGTIFDYTTEMDALIRSRDKPWRMAIIDGIPKIVMEFIDEDVQQAVYSMCWALKCVPSIKLNTIEINYSITDQSMRRQLDSLALSLDMQNGECNAKIPEVIRNWVEFDDAIIRMMQLNVEDLKFALQGNPEQFKFKVTDRRMFKPKTDLSSHKLMSSQVGISWE
uniref:Polyprotein n=1 Tax=Apis mellifera associated alphaendornavirus 1 TaxID=3238873 RepID=A0AB39BZ19_9VIRU